MAGRKGRQRESTSLLRTESVRSGPTLVAFRNLGSLHQGRLRIQSPRGLGTIRIGLGGAQTSGTLEVSPSTAYHRFFLTSFDNNQCGRTHPVCFPSNTGACLGKTGFHSDTGSASLDNPNWQGLPEPGRGTPAPGRAALGWAGEGRCLRPRHHVAARPPESSH